MTADSTTPLQVPAPGTYRVDPHRSTLSYSGRHRFNTGTVHATFTISSGEIRVADSLTDSVVTVTVDAASFKSNSARRDKDVKSAKLLDVATYPTIAFVSDRIRDEGDRWIVSGKVTAHGSTVQVDVAVDRLTPDGDGFRLHGRAEHLDRYAFGVTKGKGMVGRHLDLELDVVASPT